MQNLSFLFEHYRRSLHIWIKIDAKRTFDNYLEFNILRGANNIKTFSNYSWISGFVYIPSIIYGIPLRNLKDKKKIKIIIFKLNIFKYKLINLIRKFRRILIYK